MMKEGDTYINMLFGSLNGNVEQYFEAPKQTESETTEPCDNEETPKEQPDTAARQKEEKMMSARGRKKMHLFMKDNEKDEETTKRMADLFMDFLKECNCESSRMMETRNDSYIAKAFTAFFDYWRNKGCVDKILNGRACYRFLTEDCQLTCNTTQKNYSDWIKKRIETTTPDIEITNSVTKFMGNHR